MVQYMSRIRSLAYIGIFPKESRISGFVRITLSPFLFVPVVSYDGVASYCWSEKWG